MRFFWRWMSRSFSGEIYRWNISSRFVREGKKCTADFLYSFRTARGFPAGGKSFWRHSCRILLCAADLALCKPPFRTEQHWLDAAAKYHTKSAEEPIEPYFQALFWHCGIVGISGILSFDIYSGRHRHKAVVARSCLFQTGAHGISRTLVHVLEIPHYENQCQKRRGSGHQKWSSEDSFRRFSATHLARRTSSVHQCLERRYVRGRAASPHAQAYGGIHGSCRPLHGSPCRQTGNNGMGAGQRIPWADRRTMENGTPCRAWRVVYRKLDVPPRP